MKCMSFNILEKNFDLIFYPDFFFVVHSLNKFNVFNKFRNIKNIFSELTIFKESS